MTIRFWALHFVLFFAFCEDLVSGNIRFMIIVLAIVMNTGHSHGNLEHYYDQEYNSG